MEKTKDTPGHAENPAESPLYLGPSQPKKGFKLHFYIHKPHIQNSITSHGPSWAHPNSQQSQYENLQFSPYNYPFCKNYPNEL